MIESKKRHSTAIVGLLELVKAAAARGPAGYGDLIDTASHHDGYPSHASGSDSSPTGAPELTSTEGAAHARLGDLIDLPSDSDGFRPGPTRRAERMIHLRGVATAAIHEYLTLAESGTPDSKAGSADLCAGGVGYDWWTPPRSTPAASSCVNVQEKGRLAGLCSRCRMLKHRNERDAECSM